MIKQIWTGNCRFGEETAKDIIVTCLHYTLYYTYNGVQAYECMKMPEGLCEVSGCKGNNLHITEM